MSTNDQHDPLSFRSHPHFISLKEVVGSGIERLALFVGAGFSRLANPRLNMWRDLLLKAADQLSSISIDGSCIKVDIEKMVEKGNYLYAAWIARHFLGEDNYRRFLEQEFSATTPYPQPLRSSFSRFLTSTNCNLILTTNFDKILETTLNGSVNDQFDNQANFSSWVVLTHKNCDQARQDIFKGSPVILKVHGDIKDFDSIIFTMVDYQKLYMGRGDFQFLIAKLMDSYTFLFVGFSLDDPFFTKVLDITSSYYGPFKQRHFAIVNDITAVEMVAWENLRGIKIVPICTSEKRKDDDFVSIYQALFQDLAPSPTNEIDKTTVLEEVPSTSSIKIESPTEIYKVKNIIEDELTSLADWKDWAGGPSIVEDAGRSVVRVNYINAPDKGNNASIYKKIGTYEQGTRFVFSVEYKCSEGFNGMIFVGDSSGPDPYDNCVTVKEKGSGNWATLTGKLVLTHSDVCFVWLYGNKEGGKQGDFVLYRNLKITIFV